jgi:hypothetical protein
VWAVVFYPTTTLLCAVCYNLLSYADRFAGEAETQPVKSPLTESNCRPFPYHGNALPTELRGRIDHRSGQHRLVIMP